MLKDGRVAALWGGGLAWPGFVAVARQPGGARFLAPKAEEIDRILGTAPFLQRMTVPAGSYAGQDAPILSVGSWSFVLTRADLSEETAYRLARALRRAENARMTGPPEMRETTLANSVVAAHDVELIHPGVRRYLREIGLVK
jgi:TRAP transporter TAXI family solute receptor